MVNQRRLARLDALANQQWDTEVTEIIPINEFGALADETFGHTAPFANDLRVLAAPELDDLNDLAEECPRLLITRASETRATRPTRRQPVSGTRPDYGRIPARRMATNGKHRAMSTTHRRTVQAAGPLHSRLIIGAIAAGAVGAGANSTVSPSEVQADPKLGAEITAALSDSAPDAAGMQIVQLVSSFDSTVHKEELARGTAFANERAQREARLRRPQFAFPAQGMLTSGFGARWGTLHAGLDIANEIGTPVYAASDGLVIASGPTPGFGMWVKIRAADGTITLYGHIDSATVREGDRVMAGDQIATMGNRGNSTGPHLHFEVHLNGSDKADPMAWLRARGVLGI